MAIAATTPTFPKTLTHLRPHQPSPSLVPFRHRPLSSAVTLHLSLLPRSSAPLTPIHCSSSSNPSPSPSPSPSPTFHGPCYVLGDNIDTDQIIPAEHLTLVPSKPDEYRRLGALALSGLPSSLHSIPFVDSTADTTRFPIIVAGSNFGCGSSREHAPVALGASGVRAVVAGSFARIFFRNSVATGEIYPVEFESDGLSNECTTGDILTVDLGESKLINHTTGKVYDLKPIGDAGPVIEAGGIFAYARDTGMISA